MNSGPRTRMNLLQVLCVGVFCLPQFLAPLPICVQSRMRSLRSLVGCIDGYAMAIAVSSSPSSVRQYSIPPPLDIDDSSIYARKSRGKGGGIPVPSGNVADSLLRLCPALEARISDLRRDNTAAARFLNKAQVTFQSAGPDQQRHRSFPPLQNTWALPSLHEHERSPAAAKPPMELIPGLREGQKNPPHATARASTARERGNEASLL